MVELDFCALERADATNAQRHCSDGQGALVRPDRSLLAKHKKIPLEQSAPRARSAYSPLGRTTAFLIQPPRAALL